MRETEIRPRALFDEFLAIARDDIAIYFSETERFGAVPCPACLSQESELAFRKHGYCYRSCRGCASLYTSPRPTAEMIRRYYRESASSKFWAERFFPETAEARRAQIFRPRAETIAGLVSRLGVPSPRILADVGSGYGIFLEEMERAAGALDEVIGIEPAPDLAASCRRRGFRVIEKPVEEVTSGELQAAIVTSFEVLEHLYSPEEFLRAIREVMLPGGLLVFTTLTISGWDLQVLWAESKSISPPHHINLLSTEGLERLVLRAGFAVEEIATPGKLDVDIVRNMLEENPELSLPRFADYLIRHRGPESWDAFQQFLQQHCLSSHVRVVARKLG